MSDRDYATSAQGPDGPPRLGHWRRKPRSRLNQGFGSARSGFDVAPAAMPQPSPELSAEEAAVLRELEITPTPDWSETPVAAPTAPAASPAATAIATAPPVSKIAPPPAPITAPRPEELVRDLRPAGGHGGPSVQRYGVPDYGLGRNWGSTWRWTAQGWVDREGANPTWRPVVTTTGEVSNWEHDTYLGVVAGEASVASVVDSGTLGRALEEGRETALKGLIDAGVARGAHAVVGVNVAYTELNDRVVVTATGTAVTLRER